ncbi:acetyltransferase [Polaribacter sp. WD7]|nr:acetyltransferase [Polaribacter sp. WD7]RCS27693.1 acetyltransferase [Polaribacter sp. WD7]
MSRLQYKSRNQKNPYTSSWTIKEAVLIRVWSFCWSLLYKYSPKKMGNYWRIFLLKLFGAKVDWDVFLYPSSKIYVPWLLKIESKSCLGPYSEVYNLGQVNIKKRVTISQYTYICNGTHDMSDLKSPLMIGVINIANDVFIGAKAFVLPGICIEEYAVIGACAVVTKDVKAYDIVGGNPAKFIKKRVING